MWGQGFTKTKRLKDTDNVASYLMAYLTNVPKDEIVPGTIKKGIIKGARLHFIRLVYIFIEVQEA